MSSRRILFSFLVFINLLLSCQKTEVPVLGSELPDEEIVFPDTTVASTLKIAIIGDSISSFKGSSPSDVIGYEGAKYATYYPHGDVKNVEDMWWHIVARSIGTSIDDISNCSWSGSRVSGNSAATDNAYAGCSTKRIEDLSCKGFIPDIVFCYISCNDWANNIPLGLWSTENSIPVDGNLSTMREAYASMLHKVKERYPSSLVFCMTILEDPLRDYTDGWPSNNRRGVSLADWNNNIIELSEFFHCYTINLQECGINYDNASKYTVDGGLHPNNAGMSLIADKVIKELTGLLNTRR